MDAPLLNVNVKTYLRFPLTLLKLFESLEPTVVIAVIAATAINAAIKPYSMAVAPFWSLENAWFPADFYLVSGRNHPLRLLIEAVLHVDCLLGSEQ